MVDCFTIRPPPVQTRHLYYTRQPQVIIKLQHRRIWKRHVSTRKHLYHSRQHRRRWHTIKTQLPFKTLVCLWPSSLRQPDHNVRSAFRRHLVRHNSGLVLQSTIIAITITITWSSQIRPTILRNSSSKPSSVAHSNRGFIYDTQIWYIETKLIPAGVKETN